MKVVFWAVPVLAAVASHFVGCAEAGELGDRVLPFVEEVRMLADIRNQRERDKLQIELNETRYRETTRAISFLTASFDKQVEELIATKEPSTRDLFLQVLEAQGDTERVELLKRAMAKRNRTRSRASQSRGKQSRSRRGPSQTLPLRAVMEFGKGKFKYAEKLELFKFFEEIGGGSRMTELLEALDISESRAIAMELKEFARRRGSSGSEKSPEEIDELFTKLSRRVMSPARDFLTYEETMAIYRLGGTVPDTPPQPPPERQVDVPLRAVMEFGKLSFISDKAKVLKFLQEIGRGEIANELYRAFRGCDLKALDMDLRRMGNPLERQSSSSRSKKSPEELTDLLKKFDSEDALEVAFEFLAPEEQENIMRLSPKDFKKPGTVIPHLQLADVPFEAVVKVGKLTSSEKLEFFKYLKKTGRVAIREGLLNSIDEADRDFFDEQLNELEPFSGEPSERQRSKISPEELMAELKELGKKVSKVAFEFLTPEEKDSLRAVGYQEG